MASYGSDLAEQTSYGLGVVACGDPRYELALRSLSFKSCRTRMETETARRYRPVDASLSEFPLLPRQWRRIIDGETRNFRTQLSSEECRARLGAIMSKSQLRPGRSKVLGEIGARSFLFRLRGGMSGDVGPSPYLYGVMIEGEDGTLITARKAFPRIVLLPVPAFLAMSALASLLAVLGQLSSFHSDPVGYLIGLAFFPAGIVAFAYSTRRFCNEMNRNHFRFMADLLEAKEVDANETLWHLHWID